MRARKESSLHPRAESSLRESRLRKPEAGIGEHPALSQRESCRVGARARRREWIWICGTRVSALRTRQNRVSSKLSWKPEFTERKCRRADVRIPERAPGVAVGARSGRTAAIPPT